MSKFILVACNMLENQIDWTAVLEAMNSTDKIHMFEETWDVCGGVVNVIKHTLVVTANAQSVCCGKSRAVASQGVRHEDLEVWPGRS